MPDCANRRIATCLSGFWSLQDPHSPEQDAAFGMERLVLRRRRMSRNLLIALALTAGAFGCGSSGSDESHATECGQRTSTKDLSVIDRSYDDVSGAMACKDSPIEIYSGNASSDPPGPSGLVPAPSGTPIAQGRTSGAFAEFSLPAGDYTVCLAYPQPSCGHVTLRGKHVYATFTGGPVTSWSASEDIATSIR